MQHQHGWVPYPQRQAPQPRQPKKTRPIVVVLLIGVVLGAVTLVATCVGGFLLRGNRADETLRACGPGGGAAACGEVTGTTNDEAARDQIQAAVATMTERFGAYVSMSSRGTCSGVTGRGRVQGLWAEVEFEHERIPMAFVWENDTLVAFGPSDSAPECS